VKKFIVLLLALMIAPLSAAFADSDGGVIVKPNAAKRFATLPDGVRFPEGITANPYTGDIIVSTFDVAGNNKLLRYDPQGHLVAQIDFGAEPLLGLAFNPHDNKVYICNAGNLVGAGAARIQRVDANFSDGAAVEEVALIPSIGAPPNRDEGNPDLSTDTIQFGNNTQAPNAIVFKQNGDLLVSDSFQGAIFSITDPANECPGCGVDLVIHDGLLATPGFPPFGANGLALGTDQSTLFIANTGDDNVLRLDLNTTVLDVFARSINGADDVAYNDGLLWVAANQADQVVALNGDGRVVAELGEFLGIRADGSARGLSFPASMVIVDGKIFVTNLALALLGVPGAGAEPEADVTTYTISRINIPDIDD
jgi:sugar lactone lactonase YvrE